MSKMRIRIRGKKFIFLRQFELVFFATDQAVKLGFQPDPDLLPCVFFEIQINYFCVWIFNEKHREEGLKNCLACTPMYLVSSH